MTPDRPLHLKGRYLAEGISGVGAVSDPQLTSSDVDATGILDTPQAGTRVIRGMALRGCGYAVGLLLAIVAGAAAFRSLGVVDSGRLITVLSLVAIVGGISDLGLSSLATREYAVLQPGERDLAMRHILGLRLAFAAVGILAATLFAVAAGYPPVMVVGAVIAGSALLIAVVQQNLGVLLTATLRLGWVTALSILGQLGIAVGFVALSLVHADLTAFFAVPAVALAPVLVLTFVLVRGTIPGMPIWGLHVWRGMLREILPYSVAVVFYVLYFRFAVISVSLLSSEQQTGYYAASFRIIEALALIPALLASSAFPLLARAARDDRERLGDAITRLLHGMLILGAWLTVGLFLGAPLAIDIVAGPEFEPAVEPLRIQSIALLGTSILAVCGYGLLAIRRHRAILLANALSLALAGVLSVILVPRDGAIGAAISLTAAELGLAVGCGIALTRSDPTLLVRLGTATRILIAAAIALAVPLVLGFGSIVAVLVATSIYLAALLFLRALPPGLSQAFGPPSRRARNRLTK